MNSEEESNADGSPILGSDDPSYLSVVNPNGINPETGNRYCEDYDNCPESEEDNKLLAFGVAGGVILLATILFMRR